MAQTMHKKDGTFLTATVHRGRPSKICYIM